jgi:hypothetical protein
VIRYLLFVAIVCAGCEVTPQPYEVIAVANLGPGTQNIEGPLELLGTGEVKSGFFSYHMMVAYRVRLPDQTPRRLRLFAPASCDTPHDQATVVWNLGEIRRVGDETHFFMRDIAISDRVVDIDVITQSAAIDLDPEFRPYYALDLIAVVQDLDDDHTVPGPTFSAVPGPGPWLACAPFTLPK